MLVAISMEAQWIVVNMNGIVVNDKGVHMGRIALETMSCSE